MGRFDEAISELRVARELAPLEPWVGADLAGALNYAGRYEQAIKSSLDAIELDPGFPLARRNLGLSYVQLGKYEAGLAEAREYVELTGRDALAVAFLGWVHGVAGQRSEAQSALDELRRRAEQEHVDPLAFAWANIGVGDKDAAFEWLERGYEERSSWIIFLKVHPYYEPLRSNPRFTDLLRRTGLEPATHGAQQRSPDARPRFATCSLQHTRGRQRLSLARSRLTRQIANCAAASTTLTRLDATPVAVA